jgi:hypothetical protein
VRDVRVDEEVLVEVVVDSVETAVPTDPVVPPEVVLVEVPVTPTPTVLPPPSATSLLSPLWELKRVVQVTYQWTERSRTTLPLGLS